MRGLSDLAAHAQVFASLRRIAEPTSESDPHMVRNRQDAIEPVLYIPAAEHAQDLHGDPDGLRRKPQVLHNAAEVGAARIVPSASPPDRKEL